MKRGIVMSVHAKHAVVMTVEGQFIRAPLQGSPQIGEEIVFEEEQSEPRRMKWNRISMRYTAIAAMLGIMLIAGLAYAFSATHPVVAYLTMDINPSVEIGVDGGEKVRKLRALNEDGEQIIAGIAYKGVDVETVAAAILEQASNAHYLDAPHKDILITSVLLNGKKQPGLEFESLLTSKLDEKLQKWLAEHTGTNQAVTITTLSVPESLRVEADANGISSGKMAVYLMAKYEGYQVELSKLKEESIDSWSEPIGGMKSIVATEDEAETKKKLEKLLAKEKKAQQAKGGSSGADKTTKPASTATPKPSAKPSSKPTVKPSVKPSESSKPNRHGWWHDRDEDDRDDDDDDDYRPTSGKWNNGKNHDKWKNHNWNKDWNNQWNNSKHNGWYNSNDNKNSKDKKSDKDNKNSSINGKTGKTGTDESKNGNKNKGESDKNSTKNNGKNSSKTDQKGNKQNERDKDSSKKGSRNEQDKDDDDDRSGRNPGNSDRDRDKADDRKASSRDGRQHSSRD
ncbi:anti-sigma factor domain-containing protein [Paenibacillus sp. NPDC057967]|uniref:anti-sigma factor domain-containing protein n=1 Tax=Paenibacillus sp. NPDC057967 TaxID=3346293 RepID=UPI0036DF635D